MSLVLLTRTAKRLEAPRNRVCQQPRYVDLVNEYVRHYKLMHRFSLILSRCYIFFSFILFPLYVGSMYDDISLHVARSYTSSAYSPFSLMLSFNLSNHNYSLRSSSLPSPLYFHYHRPPPYAVFLSSHHMPIPLLPSFLYFLCDFPHFRWPLILSFLILSSFVTRHIHCSILISATSNLFSCAIFNAHVSAP